MIPALLHQLDSAKARTHLPWRSLCGPVPYPSVMRWRKRRRLNQPLCQSPGPKKNEPFNAAQFYPLLRELNPGPARTPGAGELYAQFAEALSRRQFQALVREQRQDQLQAMKRITWLHPGTAWSCDATEQDNHQIIVVQDLAARYRFTPLVLTQLDGTRIAPPISKPCSASMARRCSSSGITARLSTARLWTTSWPASACCL